jgi:hypothetical protein
MLLLSGLEDKAGDVPFSRFTFDEHYDSCRIQGRDGQVQAVRDRWFHVCLFACLTD